MLTSSASAQAGPGPQQIRPPVFRSPKRISITVPCRLYENLMERSDQEGRSLSNLVAFLLEHASFSPSPPRQHTTKTEAERAMGALSAVEMHQRFCAVQIPLRHLRSEQPVDMHHLPVQTRAAVASERAVSAIRCTGGLCEMPLLTVGALTVVVGRVTPLDLSLEANGQLSVHIAYSGLDALTRFPSELVLHLSTADSAALRTVFDLIVQLLLEDPLIAQMLGVDEQLYRLVAIQQLKAMGLLQRVIERVHQLRPSSPGKVIDRLVDDIEGHLDKPLTLTDHKSHSGYSGRRLQQLIQGALG